MGPSKNPMVEMEQAALDSLDDDLTSFLLEVRSRSNVPGLAVAVSMPGRSIEVGVGERWLGAGEPPAPDDSYDLGCVGHLLTAMVTLELASRGALSLDAALGEYLEELDGTLHGESVRVRHLLSHTSGYGAMHEHDAPDEASRWSRLVESFRATMRPFFTPGKVFSYQAADFLLMEAVLRRVTGQTPADLVTDMIVEPVAARSAGKGAAIGEAPRAGRHRFDSSRRAFKLLALPQRSVFRSSFDLQLSLRGLVAIAETLIGASSEEREDCVSPVLSELLRPAVRLPSIVGGELTALMPTAFGLGAAELPGGFWGRSGLSVGQCVALGFDVRRRIYVAVGVNAAMPHVRNLILSSVLQALTGRHGHRESTPFGLDLNDLAGCYSNGGEREAVASMRRETLLCCVGMRGRAPGVCANLAVDANGIPSLLGAPPHLSLAFFSEPGTDALGLMVGMNAFKRFASARAR
jgi:CubicO group peptidase (beta-lactamase class C family)